MTATTNHRQADDVDLDDDEDVLDQPDPHHNGRTDDDGGEEFPDPDPDAEHDTASPVEGRERSTRATVAVLVAVAALLVAARWFGWGPFGGDDDSGGTAAGGGVPAQFVLPQEVIDAISLAQRPGGLSSFSNSGATAGVVDQEVCDGLPPFTNEALWGFAQGDGNLLCQRAVQNGAAPCSLWVGVATTETGALFYLSTSGEPLPDQKSRPTRLFYCQEAAAELTPTTTATPAPAPPPAPAPAPEAPAPTAVPGAGA